MGKKIARIIGRVLLVVLVTIVMLVGTLFIMIKRICSDSAPAARNLFISTVLESGQMKFLASWFCTDAQINEVINANKMESMDSDIDTSLINISSDTDTQTVDNNGEVEQFDGNGIRMVEISGRSFFGKMLIIKDPSQVKVGTTYPWGDYGKELHEIVSGAGAVAGVNGGLYVSSGNRGGSPLGIVVQDGKITYNSPSALSGLYLIGLNKDNLLVVKDIDGMSAADFESYVNEAGLSGTCQTATMVADDYDGKVQVVNNQRISVTMRQSVLDAKELAKRGKSAAEIKEILEKHKMESSIYITLDTLKYLKKGGRITPAAAAIGTMLKLNPVLQIQGEKLDAFAKARGKASAKKIMLKAMQDDLDTRFAEFAKDGKMHMEVAYSGNPEEAEEWAALVKETFPQFDFHMDPLSLSVACHIGHGALAIATSAYLPELD